ncbi:MAG: hypothetical protein A2W77_06590 [Nitrospinae bacterium RIFCSPLOWO2_12_39_16]|nr:MAG: hypothetical protein A2W77_06590 [Nitrospinae bacterium RIFCSPLOWO2_12_39_16]
MKQFAYKYIIPFFGSVYIYIIGLTCRRIVINKEIEEFLLKQGINPIYTFWHGRMLYFPYLYRFQNKHHILASPSKDGEIIGNLLKIYGFNIVWGSTFKKGAKALLNLIRVIKNGDSVVLIADGSRGPAFKAQDGAIKIAKLTGIPIVPMTYSVSRKKVLNSWDRFVIPYPFSKIAVKYGEPVYVPPDADDEVMELKRQELEKKLNDITEFADKYFTSGHK